MHNWRMWLGDKLYRVGEVLQEWGMELTGAREAMQQTPEEEALSARKSQDNLQRILARHRRPCQTCEGNQYIRVPDGWEHCPDCAATGVAP